MSAEGIWEQRKALIERRNEQVASAYAAYDEQARAEDAAHDKVFDEIRTKYEAARDRPRPDHRGLANKRTEAIEAAERELDAALSALYTEAGARDSRYNP